ncbi:hypothetical protein OsJ_20220 [Oryza sativa Japonica Group]|uniref:Uncharacterized protein n=1 Tax=Oryza sativa subsp. japonica TaxID=39947 RepID=A3B8M8_ORYSJ|nr:hypothetical protein OsJ_20220 [Oryza sativa Japonica Group]
MDETETERESSAVQVSELADDPEPRCMSLEETKQLIGYMNTIVDSLLKIVDSGYSPYPVEEIHEIIRDIRRRMRRDGNGIGSGGARSGNPRPVLGLYRLPTYSNLKQDGNGIGSGGARSGNPRPVLGLYRLPTYSNLKQGSRM